MKNRLHQIRNKDHLVFLDKAKCPSNVLYVKLCIKIFFSTCLMLLACSVLNFIYFDSNICYMPESNCLEVAYKQRGPCMLAAYRKRP